LINSSIEGTGYSAGWRGIDTKDTERIPTFNNDILHLDYKLVYQAGKFLGVKAFKKCPWISMRTQI
jgi:hypothetical protein